MYICFCLKEYTQIHLLLSTTLTLAAAVCLWKTESCSRHSIWFSLSNFIIYNITEWDLTLSLKITERQECIPVGCVPPAHWPYLIEKTMHAPPEQPRMPPSPQKQLCMPPQSNHTCSPLEQPCTPPHKQPCMPPPLWTEWQTPVKT